MPVSPDGSPDLNMWWLDGGERLPDIIPTRRLEVPGTVPPGFNYHHCRRPLALVSQPGEQANSLSSLTGLFYLA